MAKLREILKSTTNRRGATAWAVVVCLILFSFLLWNQLAVAPVALDEESQELIVKGAVLEASDPVHIRIPSVYVDASFEEPIGLEASGEIEVPKGYDTVSYYEYGPTPGELGPSVILGHVDSYTGPAVFFGIGQLEEGDEIEIDREDGTTAIFAVTRLERHPQSGFPTREVYQDIDHAGLRLITCSGTYDRNVLRYTHNLIVFAELVDVR